MENRSSKFVSPASSPSAAPAVAPAAASPADPFRELVENSIRGTAIVRGRRCIYCNPAFARLFGMSEPAEALAMTDLFQLVSSADRDRITSDARRFTSGDPGVSSHHLFRARRRDGTEIWVELDGRNIVWEGEPALHVTGRDVTEQKSIEASRDLLASAAEQAQEAIYMTDVSGTILYANPTLARLTGYSLTELIGANPRIFKSGKHDDAYYTAMWKCLLGGENWASRVVNRRKDNTLIELDSRVSPVRDDNGKITHFIGVQYDVTKTVALENRVRQSEKMETLGQLAGGVAHDFNNLLQVISGWTLLVMEESPAGSPTHRNLQRVEQAVARAVGLTRQLLSMSRKSIPHPKAVDLNGLMSNQTALLARLLGEQVDLRTVPGHGLDPIHADPGMVEQILMNLCINARDAMPGGGKLIVETRNAHLGDDFCRTHDWARPGAYVQLSVSDTGIGMTRDVRERIFEPFFTTKEAGKGTGLGLATVMSIAEQHRALLHVYSEPGMGSTFHVYFPAITSAAGTLPEARTFQAPRAGRDERLLLVEDDPAVGEFMRETLQRGGYRVEHATDGQQAVDLFLRDSARFDLVILDMVLPKLTGRQVFELIDGQRPGTRFLFSSGYSPHVMDIEFVRERRMPLLQKPYAPAALLDEVGRALDGQGGSATSAPEAG